tara:strand:+ start:1195 stop:1560 length:366 start_codon:yes stop_codon:yes gene_type:complete
MRILRKHSAIRVRQGTNSYYDEGGNKVDGTAECCTPIRCCIQPEFSGAKVQKDLPEGIRERDCRTVYTHENIVAASEYDDTAADILRFEGRDFEVFECNPWNGAGRIKAWEVIVIRKDKIR